MLRPGEPEWRALLSEDVLERLRAYKARSRPDPSDIEKIDGCGLMAKGLPNWVRTLEREPERKGLPLALRARLEEAKREDLETDC